MTVEMWKDFSLPEGGYDDVGGAIMYALRYSSEVLEAKREQIAQVLDSFEGLSIRNIGDEGYQVEVSKEIESGVERIMALLEEQTVLLGALVYKSALERLGIHRVKDFQDYILGEFSSLGRGGKSRKSDAYNSVDVGIGTMVYEMTIAEKQNGVLTSKQKRLLSEIISVRSRFLKVSGGRYVIV